MVFRKIVRECSNWLPPWIVVKSTFSDSRHFEPILRFWGVAKSRKNGKCYNKRFCSSVIKMKSQPGQNGTGWSSATVIKMINVARGTTKWLALVLRVQLERGWGCRKTRPPDGYVKMSGSKRYPLFWWWLKLSLLDGYFKMIPRQLSSDWRLGGRKSRPVEWLTLSPIRIIQTLRAML